MEAGVILFDLIFKPGAALRKISREKPVSAAMLITFLATFAVVMSVLLTFSPARQNMLAAVLFGASISLLRLIFLLVLSLFVFLVSRLLLGKGSYMALFSSLGFIQFILVFLPVIEAIGSMQGGAEFISIWLRNAVYIWLVIMVVLAVKESLKISTGRAVLSLILTGAGITFLIVFTILSMTAMISF